MVNGIDFDRDLHKSEIFAQQQDALRASIDGLGIKYPSYEDNWELDTYDDSKTYLDGFFTEDVVATEDEIINHDMKFFSDFKEEDGYHIKTNVFSDENNKILVTMVNRNAIEQVLGVDLVYYNEEAESFTLVQYKRMTKSDKGKTFSYYPGSDGNYEKDIGLMQTHTDTLHKIETDRIGENLNKYYDDYRGFGSPFFFKFTNSVIFKPFHNSVIQGFYLPFDMWMSFVEDRKRIGKTLVASSKALNKYIGVNTFCWLLKIGIIGSRRCSVDEITNVMAECIRNNRSVVFAYKPSIQKDGIDIDE